ncbi:ABSCISIC ACID-INSENSITIVE 5-like protein 2 [Iris pallida]|uniref:ABSCISIC ACID-INSENSITIVE 5-like protein 2 n=1 Tax=Iris pallida TaxID=29817 RepID=A0AAX6EQP6_IRIPA|nr:ABSCISIC ACID-INSENSITIVE 5-like protein 2 [Iris pallida]
MGIQTMASQGGGGKRSQIQSLARQGSLYSLTLNEVQTHLGEPLHSMNLEELLKGLDAEQSVGVDGPAGGSSVQYASASGVQRQGSVTMPRGLVKKTVEEVWREIQQGTSKGGERRRAGHESQPTFGEMTLEDFLAKAGVMPEASSGKGGNSAVGAPPLQDYAQGAAHWLYQRMPAMDQQGMMVAYLPGHTGPPAMGGGSGQMLEATYPEGQMSLSPPTVGAMSDPQMPGRKRGHSGDVEDKMVDRRQKRMIKNRESAARSRARKQAYTNELENKVSRLEEENERLKKQKELDRILYVPPPEPKYQLRRTSSASF